jgi:hypothetical protein
MRGQSGSSTCDASRLWFVTSIRESACEDPPTRPAPGRLGGRRAASSGRPRACCPPVRDRPARAGVRPGSRGRTLTVSADAITRWSWCEPAACPRWSCPEAYKAVPRRMLEKSGGNFDPYRKWPEQLRQGAGLVGGKRDEQSARPATGAGTGARSRRGRSRAAELMLERSVDRDELVAFACGLLPRF